ncbi:DUF6602 domain-containing protein [Streptomyces sp. NPDC001553]|uniref:DUF6602 domain-containing protein n=1 Tax=Streptomyces sp. NPDC001553 TaxID=3154385 RepID=UPI00332F946F
MSDQTSRLVSSWRPKQASDVMQRAFAERCHWVETVLRARANAEISMRATNFSSGPAIEALFRDELGKILPRRYQVACGAVSDRTGSTAGDCDVVIFNDMWFPAIKQRATADDRQHVMPIEGAYAVMEIKQTLSLQTLDEAMEKLVTCHRLDRPLTAVNRIVENRGFDKSLDRVGNPLFSAVVAARRDPKVELAELVDRFVAINSHLERLEMVHCLCVLGEGCYFWGWVPDGSTRAEIATFFGPEDLARPLMLIEAAPVHDESPLGALVSRLYSHVTNSVLEGAVNVPSRYGFGRSLQPYRQGAQLIPAVQSRRMFSGNDAP